MTDRLSTELPEFNAGRATLASCAPYPAKPGEAGNTYVLRVARQDGSRGEPRLLTGRLHPTEAGAEEEGLHAHGFPRHGVELDLGGQPDLSPVLAAVAAGAALRHGASSTLRGLATLPGKESDRLSVLADGLRRIGLAALTGVDSLRVEPGTAREEGEAPPVELDPRGDHRMAFAFALLGCLRPGVFVRDPGCVAKSWGSFWADLERLGARVQRTPAP